MNKNKEIQWKIIKIGEKYVTFLLTNCFPYYIMKDVRYLYYTDKEKF